MLVDKKYLTQQLECLTKEQLQQVNEFINFLKFQAYSANLKINETQMAELYREFAEEDRQLAEQGMNEYEEMLSSEDS
jgi:hypothetical protein